MKCHYGMTSQYQIWGQDFKSKWTIRNKKSNGLKIKTGRFIEMNRTFQTQPPGIEIRWYFEMTEARFSRKYPGESGGSSSDTKVDDQMTRGPLPISHRQGPFTLAQKTVIDRLLWIIIEDDSNDWLQDHPHFDGPSVFMSSFTSKPVQLKSFYERPILFMTTVDLWRNPQIKIEKLF